VAGFEAPGDRYGHSTEDNRICTRLKCLPAFLIVIRPVTACDRDDSQNTAPYAVAAGDVPSPKSAAACVCLEARTADLASTWYSTEGWRAIVVVNRIPLEINSPIGGRGFEAAMGCRGDNEIAGYANPASYLG